MDGGLSIASGGSSETGIGSKLTSGSTYGESVSGGAMEILSGLSSLSNSGDIRIGSPNSGTFGLSGSVQI